MQQAVLIADGDADLSDVYQGFLTERGYVVETSWDGLDCMKKLRQRMPAAIVLDLELHWGGGDGVLAWLREESPTDALPVILTATMACPDDIAELIDAGVVEYLAKPFTLAALLEKVRSVVARQAPKQLTPFVFTRSISSDDKETLSMAQPASLVVLPTREHADEESALEATAAHLQRGLEDLLLAERIERALRATGHSALGDIDVFVNARNVHLVGQVPSFHLKQIAQATALAIPDTHQVHNDLDVMPLK